MKKKLLSFKIKWYAFVYNRGPNKQEMAQNRVTNGKQCKSEVTELKKNPQNNKKYFLTFKKYSIILSGSNNRILSQLTKITVIV